MVTLGRLPTPPTPYKRDKTSWVRLWRTQRQEPGLMCLVVYRPSRPSYLNLNPHQYLSNLNPRGQVRRGGRGTRPPQHPLCVPLVPVSRVRQISWGLSTRLRKRTDEKD